MRRRPNPPPQPRDGSSKRRWMDSSVPSARGTAGAASTLMVTGCSLFSNLAGEVCSSPLSPPLQAVLSGEARLRLLPLLGISVRCDLAVPGPAAMLATTSHRSPSAAAPQQHGYVAKSGQMVAWPACSAARPRCSVELACSGRFAEEARWGGRTTARWIYPPGRDNRRVSNRCIRRSLLELRSNGSGVPVDQEREEGVEEVKLHVSFVMFPPDESF